MKEPSKIPLIFPWWIKKAFQRLPQKPNPHGQEVEKIGYYFSGTYGDLFQSLSSWYFIREKYPNAKIYLRIPAAYFSQVKSLLPPNCFFMSWKEIFQGLDLFFTNVVGVYKNYPLFIGYFFTKRYYGFCYGEEKGRKAQSFSLQLSSQYNNNVFIQNYLISKSLEDTNRIWEKLPEKFLSELNSPSPLEIHNKKALLHIGSSGLKKNVGLQLYCQKNLELIQILQDNHFEVNVICGPQDRVEENFLREFKPGLSYKHLSLMELLDYTKSFDGLIVCWNSMFAHLCSYLNKPCVVLQHNKTPIGYDNGQLHHQLILRNEDGLSLKPLKDLFEGVKS